MLLKFPTKITLIPLITGLLPGTLAATRLRKRIHLATTVQNSTQGTNSVIDVCLFNNGKREQDLRLEHLYFSTGICNSDVQGPDSTKRRIIIGSVACGSLLLTVAAGVFIVCFCRQKLMPQGIFNRKGFKGYPMMTKSEYSNLVRRVKNRKSKLNASKSVLCMCLVFNV